MTAPKIKLPPSLVKKITDSYKEPVGVLDLLEADILEKVKALPKLPPGWVYDFDFDTVQDEKSPSTFYFRVTAKPRQLYELEEGKV